MSPLLSRTLGEGDTEPLPPHTIAALDLGVAQAARLLFLATGEETGAHGGARLELGDRKGLTGTTSGLWDSWSYLRLLSSATEQGSSRDTTFSNGHGCVPTRLD